MKLKGLSFKTLIFLILCFCFYLPAYALSERHLVIIAYQEDMNAQPLVPQANVVNDIANLLLTYGFDNRSIAAVYVPQKATIKALAEKMATIGLYTGSKIHVDKRLDEELSFRAKVPLLKKYQKRKNISTMAQARVHYNVEALYDEVESHYPKGHIVMIMPPVCATELIDALTQSRVYLKPAQAYMLPLAKRV